MANDSAVVVQLKLLGAGQFSKDGRTAIASLEALDVAGGKAGTSLGATGRGSTSASTGLTRMNGAASKGGGALSTLKNAASGAFGMMTRLAGPVVALAGAFGFYSMVKGAIQFDQQMRSVNAILKLSTPQFQSLEQQVNALARSTWQSPTSLAKGMLQVTQEGFRGAGALNVLEAAGKAATAGQVSLSDSITAVTRVMAAYHLAASSAGNVTDTLFKITEQGPVSFGDLASGLGKIIPVAAAVKVPLDQVGAAIDTLARQMGAPKAMMGLTNIFSKMLKPSKDLQAAIEGTGYSSGTALLQAKGLQGALELLTKSTGGSTDKMAKLFPGVRSVAAALGLTGKNAQAAKNDLKAFGDTSGATANAMKQAALTPAGAWQHFKSTMQSLGNELALKVLPTITSVANALTDLFSGKGKVGKAASGFMSGLTKGLPPATGQAAPPIVGPMDAYGGHQVITQQTMPNISQAQKVGAEVRKIFSDIGKALAPVAKAVGGVASSLVKAFKPLLPVLVPIGRILLTVFVVALQAAAVYFTVLGKVIGFVIGVIGGALKGVLTAFKAVWDAISTAVGAVSTAFSWLWHNALEPIGKFIAGAFMVAIAPFAAIWDVIKGAVDGVGAAFNALKGFLLGLVGPITTVVNGLGNIITNLLGIQNAQKVVGNVPTPKSPIPFGIPAATPSPGIGHRAGGGASSGFPTLVGEHGPELITGGRGSQVHNARETARLLHAGAAAAAPRLMSSHRIVIENHVPIYLDRKLMHKAVYTQERVIAEAS